MKMLNKSKNFLIICLFIIINSKSLESFENKILFKVNNEIITTIDIYEEIKFLKIFNPEINNIRVIERNIRNAEDRFDGSINKI